MRPTWPLALAVSALWTGCEGPPQVSIERWASTFSPGARLALGLRARLLAGLAGPGPRGLGTPAGWGAADNPWDPLDPVLSDPGDERPGGGYWRFPALRVMPAGPAPVPVPGQTLVLDQVRDEGATPGGDLLELIGAYQERGGPGTLVLDAGGVAHLGARGGHPEGRPYRRAGQRVLVGAGAPRVFTLLRDGVLRAPDGAVYTLITYGGEP